MICSTTSSPRHCCFTFLRLPRWWSCDTSGRMRNVRTAQPGYPVIPAIYVVGAGAVVLCLFIDRPATTWPGLALVISGLPVYWVVRRAGSRQSLGNSLVRPFDKWRVNRRDLRFSSLLLDLSANLTAGIRRRMDIEIPFACDQIFHLVWSESCFAINRAHNGADLDGKLWLGVLTGHRGTVKVRGCGRTSQTLKCDVISKHIRIRIHRSRERSMARCSFGRNFARGCQVGG